MEIKLSKWIIKGFCVLSLSCMIAIPCSANSLAVNHTFQTFNQSMWGSGSASVFSYGGFYGLSWNKSGGVDALGCGFFGDCYGAEFNAYTSGKIGVNVGFEVNSGSVSADVPALINLSLPDAVSPYSGQTTFVANAIAGYGAGLLTTTSPGVSAYADLVFKILAGATGELCFVDCATFGGNIVNLNKTAELIAFNRNNDGELRLLGNTLGLPASGDIGGYIDYTVSLPSISTTGLGFPPIVSNGTSGFIDLNANVVNIAASALGIPPLSGSVGPINYNLLSAGIGLDIGLYQDFSLMPNVHIRLDVAETGQTIFFNPGTSSPVINVPYNVTSLHITPTYSMDGLFSNDTGFDLSPYVYASGGYFGMSGIGSVGPLFNQTYNLGNLPISVYDTSFSLGGFDSFTGSTLVVDVVPEPGSLVLLGSGLAAIVAANLRKRKNRKGSCEIL